MAKHSHARQLARLRADIAHERRLYLAELDAGHDAVAEWHEVAVDALLDELAHLIEHES